MKIHWEKNNKRQSNNYLLDCVTIVITAVITVVIRVVRRVYCCTTGGRSSPRGWTPMKRGLPDCKMASVIPGCHLGACRHVRPAPVLLGSNIGRAISMLLAVAATATVTTALIALRMLLTTIVVAVAVTIEAVPTVVAAPVIFENRRESLISLRSSRLPRITEYSLTSTSHAPRKRIDESTAKIDERPLRVGESRCSIEEHRRSTSESMTSS